MFQQSIRLLTRLIARHSVYYLISFSSLTLGICAFFLLSLYVYFENSFDTFHEHAANVYRISTTSARSPVPMAAALKPVAGIQNTCRFIMTTSGTSLIVRSDKGDLFEENVYYADSTFFDFFSFPFSGPTPRGPLTLPDETIITRRLAEKYFPGEQAVGRTIEYTNSNLSTNVFRIIGVVENLPSNTQFDFDVLLPFSQYGSHQSQLWSNNIIYTYVKLEPNTDPARVLEETKKIYREQTHMTEGQPDNLRLSDLTSLHFLNDATFDFGPHNKKENIIILVSVAILVLLIAIINFVNLTTANATSRVKEVGLRKAIGASFRNLFRQFTGEAVAIAYGSFMIAIPVIWM
ncbi:MAG TPA: ABC transporter permease, partial [Cyclobacteriaceae bacterium]|nr:ABC transporter permease [Cyclobacteriaceae bacterium]